VVKNKAKPSMVTKWYKTFGGKRVKVKIINAQDNEGFLLSNLPKDGGFRFRVYGDLVNDESGKAKRTFIDYPIAHSDLEIKIIGEAAFYYRDDGRPYLDHHPDVLGWKLDENQED
jgi:hypothetical protein